MKRQSKNGETTYSLGKESKIKSSCNSKDQGPVERDSRRIEYQSKRGAGEVGQGVGRAAVDRAIGGILGLFREVIKEGSDYIDSHGERLHTRLIEHEQKKASFLEKATALEEEIARLLEQVEKLPKDSDESE